ncbi:MAG: dephospho-CoA kinase [Bacteroidales bacterium]|nr:dephospho-CoA kinase [Bacteroidales bacterium]
MRVIGITGKIGAGKSLVASLFRLLDAHIIDVDKEAKSLYYRNDIREKIESILQQPILSGNGGINFQTIAAKYFTSKVVYEAINHVLYPVLKERIIHLIGEIDKGLIVLDAAMLFEIELDIICDQIILVKAPLKIRWERVKDRNPLMTKKDFLMRNKLQKDRFSSKVFVLKNDHRHSVLKQFEKFVQLYLAQIYVEAKT